MKHISQKFLSVIILNIAIVVGFVTTFILTKNDDLQISEASTEQISNKKICWGIKKNANHEQPNVGSINQKVLEENNGICLGNKDEKVIYLTFDNGYEAGYTTQILDTLKENKVKATFFITAHYLNTASDLVQRMIDDGHIVGNQFPTMVMYHV